VASNTAAHEARSPNSYWFQRYINFAGAISSWSFLCLEDDRLNRYYEVPILSSQARPDPLSIETTFPEAAFVMFVIDSFIVNDFIFCIGRKMGSKHPSYLLR
jgi:hypothetical protein